MRNIEYFSVRVKATTFFGDQVSESKTFCFSLQFMFKLRNFSLGEKVRTIILEICILKTKFTRFYQNLCSH